MYAHVYLVVPALALQLLLIVFHWLNAAFRDSLGGSSCGEQQRTVCCMCFCSGGSHVLDSVDQCAACVETIAIFAANLMMMM